MEKEHPIPLYWNFPVAPVLEKQSRRTANLVAAIRRRIRSGHDRVVPSGFSRAPHPLLLPEELQRELLWCYRNPWFPALKDIFAAHPEVILPAHPDLYSEAAGNAYSRQGFATIGIPIPLYRFSPPPGSSRWAGLKPLAAPEYSIRGANSGARLRPIAVLHPEEVRREGIDSLLSACGKSDTLYMMFDLSDGNSGDDSAWPAAVERLFRQLTRHRRIELHPFSSEPQKTAPTPVDPAELLKFVEPVGRFSDSRIWDQIENLRQKKRRSNLQMRDLLKSIASAAPSSTTVSSGQTKTDETDALEITNISMAGSVTLIGVGLQATFSEGRLSNLIDHGKKVLPGETGRSVFTFHSKRELLQTESAFSFDREGQTGLRSILSSRIGKEGETVEIILDYYFADERSCLTLDITARYPPLAPGIVAESTPLELCLCSFTEDDRPEIEVQAPDRDPYSYAVTAGPAVFVLAGKRFRLQHGNCSVELQAEPRQKTRSEQIEFRIEKQRNRHLLWTNLGGSYLPQPAANLSARRLNLSFGIRFGGAPRGRGKFPERRLRSRVPDQK